MVKGISRQVIMVQSPDKELFEQAIFILTDQAVENGVSDEMLLKQAKIAVRSAGDKPANIKWYPFGLLWFMAGAAATGIVWLLGTFL